jgi:Spy/CpxP family protein refolding chaperone
VTRTKGLAVAMYLGALLAGAAIALAADRAYTRKSGGPDGRSPRTWFFDELGLTPAQRDSANVIYDEAGKKSKALMEQYKTVLEPLGKARDSIETERRQRFSLLLTPEQKAKYDQMNADRARGRGGRGGPGR